jgi:hypothetical protein
VQSLSISHVASHNGERAVVVFRVSWVIHGRHNLLHHRIQIDHRQITSLDRLQKLVDFFPDLHHYDTR